MALKPHRTVDRIVQILEFVAARPAGATLTEIAKALDAPTSTIQGFVNGLVASGYVEERDRRYWLGAGPYILTLRANRMPARTVRQDDLEDLALSLDCDVLLGVRLGWNIVYVGSYGDSPHLQYLSRTRERRPLLTTTAGRCLLASMDDEQMNEYLARQDDLELVQGFLDQVAEIRATGFAFTPYSQWSRTMVLARAVRDREHRVVGILVVGNPPEQFEPRVDLIKREMIDRVDEWATRS